MRTITAQTKTSVVTAIANTSPAKLARALFGGSVARQAPIDGELSASLTSFPLSSWGAASPGAAPPCPDNDKLDRKPRVPYARTATGPMLLHSGGTSQSWGSRCSHSSLRYSIDEPALRGRLTEQVDAHLALPSHADSIASFSPTLPLLQLTNPSRFSDPKSQSWVLPMF